MTLTIIVPLLVCIAGILLYVLASNPKLQEIGRAMMWTGMLVSLMVVGGHKLSF
jgi:Na+/phosphate symporter